MTNVKHDFYGKVVLVTGGSSGIGRAAALKFASSGAQVIVADVAEVAGKKVAEEALSLGGQALFVHADVSRMDACQALVDKAISHFGRLDFAFNNAGIIAPLCPVGSCSEDVWHKVLNVNLTGVFNCLKCEVAVMKAQGGAIVNTASVMGLVGAQGAAAYCASKHGVIGLTKAAALDYGRDGIRINAICPGFVDTPMIEGNGTNANKSATVASRRAAIRRLGTPDEIADSVLWLCSDAASFVTGAALSVDGGFAAC
ncbi:SDR family NAD(P)-dependent oxidoreductase [Noviherbaspirillum sedimenti]|uniref:SDR family oxidoreductase n=1 Tax=Noviherbaspirillum sedimenti TaxID=2320865 RepID=A0A3A3GNX7_9BURK|nr:glucose 1-dehydrogenase [Noviherbaspirillum sedimenti]RJG02660.1 SDR family oxidoreductase [Noviherbaspirillum sedimenti]